MKYLKYVLGIVLVCVLSSCSNGDELVEVGTIKIDYIKNDFGYYEINQEAAKEMIDNEKVVILDVREEEEYEEGHIENSVLLPVGEVTMSAEKLIPNKDETVLVYCRSGNRSKQASYVLATLGYTNVYEFGGINTWGYDIVK